jgi:hypothetical protein
MKNIKKYLLWSVVVLMGFAVLGIGFYWIVLFPEQTRISCDEFARNAVSEITKSTNRNELIDEREDIYRYYYNSCFRQAGLKPEMK